jgi:hypothetical protein
VPWEIDGDPLLFTEGEKSSVFVRRGGTLPTINSVTSYAFAVIGNAAMGINHEHLPEAVTFRTRPDRMIIGKERWSWSLNRHVSIATVVGGFKCVGLKSGAWLVRMTGDGNSLPWTSGPGAQLNNLNRAVAESEALFKRIPDSLIRERGRGGSI